MVSFKDTLSSTAPLGVPQGSIMGLLFYVNNINNSSDILDFLLFADDTNVFISGMDVDEITQ